MPLPREIHDHVVNPANDQILIQATDGPGPGGANHEYLVQIPGGEAEDLWIDFQNGPIAEVGFNGITQEVLLAIVIDRLRSFQKGPFACDSNAKALEHAEASLEWLKSRTRDRMRRGVEGRNVA